MPRLAWKSTLLLWVWVSDTLLLLLTAVRLVKVLQVDLLVWSNWTKTLGASRACWGFIPNSNMFNSTYINTNKVCNCICDTNPYCCSTIIYLMLLCNKKYQNKLDNKHKAGLIHLAWVLLCLSPDAFRSVSQYATPSTSVGTAVASAHLNMSLWLHDGAHDSQCSKQPFWLWMACRVGEKCWYYGVIGSLPSSNTVWMVPVQIEAGTAIL